MNKRDSVLLENLWHEMKAIREGQEAMAYVPRKLDAIDDRLRNVESIVTVMKGVLTEHSRDIKGIRATLKHHTRDIAELKQSVTQIQAIL